MNSRLGDLRTEYGVFFPKRRKYQKDRRSRSCQTSRVRPFLRRLMQGQKSCPPPKARQRSHETQGTDRAVIGTLESPSQVGGRAVPEPSARRWRFALLAAATTMTERAMARSNEDDGSRGDGSRLRRLSKVGDRIAVQADTFFANPAKPGGQSTGTPSTRPRLSGRRTRCRRSQPHGSDHLAALSVDRERCLATPCATEWRRSTISPGQSTCETI
jgi:hypothetical protein